ncbi:MAG: hypothetical protein KIT54_10005 [Phycisphaeraceae bacterium]|nr:hypothetical protein [Phycisphaeraceae bacterium]
MSDVLENLKYRLEPIKEKLGMGDKPIGRLLLYIVLIVVGFGVLLWTLIPKNQPIASNPRITTPTQSTGSGDADAPPPAPSGGPRIAPSADG